MSKKGNWIVRVECTVMKDVFCVDCTEEQARSDPFDHATDEKEVSQNDWTVKSVEENK